MRTDPLPSGEGEVVIVPGAAKQPGGQIRATDRVRQCPVPPQNIPLNPSLRKGLASNPVSFGFGQTATVQAPTLIWLQSLLQLIRR
jgi:hypothetical protein